MSLVLNTAPASEPLTLAEAKAHLRIDSESFAENITTEQSIVSGDHIVAASYSLVGSSVEVSGFEVLVNLVSGTNGTGNTVTAGSFATGTVYRILTVGTTDFTLIGAASNTVGVIFTATGAGSGTGTAIALGTVDVKLQESNDNSTWSDVASGAFTQVTTDNDNAVQEKAYTGSYRYIRAVATIATATCDFGVEVIKKAGPDTEDDLLNGLIKVARQHCETFQRRSYFTQTWELWLDEFPAKDYIGLPLPPVQEPAVTAGSFATGTVYRILTVGTTDFTLIGAASSTVGVIFTATGAGSGTGTATASGIIKYYGTDNTEYFMDGADYFLDIKSEPGRVALAYGESWPSTTLRPANGVCLTYITGYSSTSSIPATWKQAMLLLIGHLYEHREEVVTSGMNAIKIPVGVEALLWPDRVF